MATKPTEILLRKNQAGDLLFDLINGANIFYSEHDQVIELQFEARGPKNPPLGDAGEPATQAVIIQGDITETATEKKISYSVNSPSFTYKKISGAGAGEQGIYSIKIKIS